MRKRQHETKATGAIGLTAPKVTMGDGLTKEEAPKRKANVTFNNAIDYLHCLHSHVQSSDSFLPLTFMPPGSLESHFTQNQAIICKILFDFLLKFWHFVQSSFVAKQTIL